MDKKLELEKNIKMLKELEKNKETLIKSETPKNCILSDEMYILNFKIDNIKNNIDLLFYYITEEELLNILRKYKNKRIGEKTIEKIKEEMEKYLKDNYNLDLSFSFDMFDASYGIYIKKIYFTFNIKATSYFLNIKYCYYEEDNINIENDFNYNYIKPEYIKEYSKNMLEDKRRAESELKELAKQVNKIMEQYTNISFEFDKKYLHNNTKNYCLNKPVLYYGNKNI